MPNDFGKLPRGTPIFELLRLEKPVFAWWQLTHAVPRGSDKLLSLKIFSPKEASGLSGVGAAAIAPADMAKATVKK
jgi:hypothetical protein